MSMNLCFRVKDGAGIVEFPFQTPTSLTYAVLKKETNEERLTLIEEYMQNLCDDPEYLGEMLEDIKRLMASPHLELSLI